MSERKREKPEKILTAFDEKILAAQNACAERIEKLAKGDVEDRIASEARDLADAIKALGDVRAQVQHELLF